jgi:hypothetical protein
MSRCPSSIANTRTAAAENCLETFKILFHYWNIGVCHVKVFWMLKYFYCLHPDERMSIQHCKHLDSSSRELLRDLQNFHGLCHVKVVWMLKYLYCLHPDEGMSIQHCKHSDSSSIELLRDLQNFVPLMEDWCMPC